MMKMTVAGAILKHEADATMMIDADPEAATMMTIMMIGDHLAVTGVGLAIPKVIQKRPDAVGTTASGLPDRARAMRTTTIVEYRAAGTTSVAGSAIAKAIPRRPVEDGTIRTTAPVAGSGIAKAIPRRPVEDGTIRTTAPVAGSAIAKAIPKRHAEAGKNRTTVQVVGSGTVKAIPKRRVEDGTILTTERAAGSAIRKGILAPPGGAGAKNPPAAAAAQRMTGTGVEAAANMRTKKERDERRSELRRSIAFNGAASGRTAVARERRTVSTACNEHTVTHPDGDRTWASPQWIAS